MKLTDLTQLKNLKSMIDYAAENFGERDFLLYKTDHGVEAKTYNQLQSSSDAFSRMLEDKGLGSSHVAVIGPTSFEWIVTYFGTADCSSTIIPLAPSETDDMNCKLIDFADTDVFVFDRKHVSLYEKVKQNVPGVKLFISVDNTSSEDDVINIETIFEDYKGEYNGDPDSDKMCALVFTSGTTGFPKGVMLSHRNLVYSAGSVHVACPTTKMFCCLPIHHCFCFTANITKSVVRGKTVCVNDSLSNILQDLQLYKPDSIIAVPQLVKKIMYGAIKFAKSKPELSEAEAVKKFLGGNIIDIISGGAPLEAAVNDRFNQTGILVMNGYGMTECAPIISNNAIGCFRHGSAGKPIPCMDVKISDGEILVKGPSVMLGYYKNPEATKAAFTDDGWLHTGDLGHFDDDGYLYITGRCKNLILLDNGENVSAEMLEDKFSTEPMIQDVICHGDNGAICAEVFLNAAYVKEQNITDIDKAMIDLLMRVNNKLASYQRISTYVVRDVPFERTSSSKIKRNPIGTAVKHTVILPKTQAEKKVCDAVKELLMLKQVGTNDNFFALGGDSLTALEFAVSLNIRPQLVYDNPFLGVLAARIDEEKKLQTVNSTDINSVIEQTKNINGETAEPFKCALLTGSTGFLGVHILKELVERKIKVYCLVRDPARLQKQVDYYFEDLDMSCVHAITGNIEDDTLGFTKERYDGLAKEVDVVFHTAANVHHAGDYSDLERTNVNGTKNVIEFAKKADAVLQHTSTVSVHGAATVIQKYKKAIFDENLLDIGQHYWDNVYIHSKYCAEEAVLLARKDGLKANIYRIGNLTWRTNDGKFQINSADNGFLSRVRATLKLGLFNDNMDKYPTDLTAVDECAKAYVNLAFNLRVNEIYHMYNPNFLETQEMFNLLDVPFRHVSSAETVETVMANSDDRDIHVYQFYLIISGRSSNVEMFNNYTVDLLKKTGFTWSKPDRGYLTVSDIPGSKGHCLDFAPYNVKPMRKTGGSLTPIQKLTLGVMRDAQLDECKVFHGDNALSGLYGHIIGCNIHKPLIVAYKCAEKNEKLRAFIDSFPENPPVFEDISGEPTLNDTQKALEAYDAGNCDCVIAIGGGSVLDTAKIIALRTANRGEYIDDICKIDCYANKCVPFFAVPTTSGTGSEVTIFAVITDTDEDKKKPFVSDKFQPSAVALDPSLTLSVPKMSTAYTGIDALSHAVEAYTSLFAPSFPEDCEIAPKACKRIFSNLKRAYNDPSDLDARDEMQQASFEAGLSFRRIGTGYIHAIAHRLGEIYHIPHGEAIAAAFTPVLHATLPYNSVQLAALAVECEIGNADDGDEVNSMKFIEAVDALINDLGIDKTAIPFSEKDAQEIVSRAQEEAKLTGYPRPFSDESLNKIVKRIFQK